MNRTVLAEFAASTVPDATPHFVQSRARQKRAASVVAVTLAICFAQYCAAGVTIQVNTTQQGGTVGQCSLQEAIYATELKTNEAIESTDPDSFYTTGCVAGTGNGDTIVLPPGDVFTFDHAWDEDAHNIFGPTATPIIFSNIIIEGNGATLQWVSKVGPGPGNSRLFAIGKVDDPNFPSGVGALTLRNVYVKGFHINGGNGGRGGGGGLGAGGAIYVGYGGSLTVENSTFEGNGAVGGNGGDLPFGAFGAGGGGGLSGNGGEGCPNGGGGGGGPRGDGGNGGCLGGSHAGTGGGGGGTAFSGGDGTSVGGSGGFRCGGNGGDGGSDGHDPSCQGAGGGGGGEGDVWCVLFSCNGNGAQGSYGGGGGGGGVNAANGGKGGFGGGGGSGGEGTWSVAGGDGDFGGGGGATVYCGLFHICEPGRGGSFGGRADDRHGGGGGALGGAIFGAYGSVQVHNCAFFNNFVTRGVRGGGSAFNGADAGGAIFVASSPLEITDSTFSGNQSTGSGGAIVAYQDGVFASQFTLNNTIIANNGADECFSNTLHKQGVGNLIMKNGVQFGRCPGVVTTSDPQLQALQLNSPGNTPTMAILITSPAFNKADPGTSLPFDQRHVPRPQLGGFDIGAFETRGAIDK
jgi:predicted outer membrane repeat protein